MSGLAMMLMSAGAIILGSDIVSNAETSKLANLGAQIHNNHSATNIDDSIELVVYSGAIHSDNPEIKMAKQLDIPTIERSVLLGIISRQYKYIIAVSGTHGKTTTTAMLGWIFVCAGLSPTIHLGGESIDLKGNTIIGSKDILILEACEYRESFRYLRPDMALITSIEWDHADYYANINEIFASFERFASRAKKVVSRIDTNILQDNNIILGKDYTYNIIQSEPNGYTFVVKYHGENLGEFHLNMIGEHNVLNATFAIITAHQYGIELPIIQYAISHFHGVARRYEKIGKLYGIPVIIDYAHHPTEIACSINGMSSVYGKILTIFQPHTYSRTLALFDEFVRVLSDLSKLIIYQTYPAREELIEGGEAIDLYIALKPYIADLHYAENINEVLEIIAKSMDIDVILVLGAGNLADIIKKQINRE